MELEDLDWSAEGLKITSIVKLLLNIICQMFVMVHKFTKISKITCTQNWVQNIMEKMFSYPKIWILWLMCDKKYTDFYNLVDGHIQARLYDIFALQKWI